jgi:uncharacterized protein (DUF2237 family)
MTGFFHNQTQTPARQTRTTVCWIMTAIPRLLDTLSNDLSITGQIRLCRRTGRAMAGACASRSCKPTKRAARQMNSRNHAQALEIVSFAVLEQHRDRPAEVSTTSERSYDWRTGRYRSPWQPVPWRPQRSLVATTAYSLTRGDRTDRGDLHHMRQRMGRSSAGIIHSICLRQLETPQAPQHRWCYILRAVISLQP